MQSMTFNPAHPGSDETADETLAPRPEPPLTRQSQPVPRVTPVAPERTIGEPRVRNAAITSRAVSVHYGAKRALFDIDLDIGRFEVTALIGPSGCGKSTFLRCLNRMNDTIDGCRVTGDIRLDGLEVQSPNLDVIQLRARVGMVFQKPNPFPKSIYDNVAYGPRIHGLIRGKTETDELVERSLTRAGLF